MSVKKISMACAAAIAGLAHAACFTDGEAASLADHFFSRSAAADIATLTDVEAACSRAKFHTALEKRHGPLIGYKIGLTNPAIQRMLRGNQPVWGKLYKGMLLENGAVVDAAFGARPTVEADLMVRVSSSAINQARTPMEVLQAIDQVIPFIELPDMLVQTPLKLDAHALMAINVAARLGVVGKPVPVPAGQREQQALLDSLRDMNLSMTDGTGRVLGQGKGSDLLGHPLNGAIWLAAALARDGQSLQPGQFISLGSFPPVISPQRGMKFITTYQGLPGAEPVSVVFRDSAQ